MVAKTPMPVVPEANRGTGAALMGCAELLRSRKFTVPVGATQPTTVQATAALKVSWEPYGCDAAGASVSVLVVGAGFIKNGRAPDELLAKAGELPVAVNVAESAWEPPVSVKAHDTAWLAAGGGALPVPSVT